MRRRDFLGTGAAVGAGLLWLGARGAESPAPPSSAVNIALIGAGEQGRVLINSALPIPGVRFRALCDIWPYRREVTKRYLAFYRHPVNDYADYRELLAKEKDLQAVLIATPDAAHAEQAAACLRAGLAVYCEPPMAATLDGARTMVRAARETARLLQVGYQRRSNPRYNHVLDKLLREAKLPGRLTHVNAQWCQPIADDLGWPRAAAMADEDLKRFGYASMNELRNWRQFKTHSAGLFAALVGHAADAVNWFLGTPPKAVLAAGGTDFYRGRQTHDNVMAILDYETPDGLVRACFQALTTTTNGGPAAFEHFLGTDGSIRISEFHKWTRIFHEPHAPDWDKWTRLNYLVKDRPPEPDGRAKLPLSQREGEAPAEPAEPKPVDPNVVRSQETGLVTGYDIPVALVKLPHQPHLENFFEALRGRARLACPADEAFRAHAVALKVNEAIEAKRMLTLAREDCQA